MAARGTRPTGSLPGCWYLFFCVSSLGVLYVDVYEYVYTKKSLLMDEQDEVGECQSTFLPLVQS